MTIKVTNKSTNEYEIIENCIQYTNNSVIISAGKGKVYQYFDENEFEITQEEQFMPQYTMEENYRR